MAKKDDSNEGMFSLELEDAEAEEALQNRLDFEKKLGEAKNVWGYSPTGLQAQKAAMTMLATKTGMYARIPIVCKGDECPYVESCSLVKYNLAPKAEYCPVETAQIEMRFMGYMKDFELDKSEIGFTDKCIISEIIDLDIMIERCKALIGKHDGVPVVDVVAGIGEDGTAYNRPEVSKYYDAYERMMKTRNSLYEKMVATRMDKKGDKNNKDEKKEVFDIMKELDGDGGFIVETKPEKVEDAKDEDNKLDKNSDEREERQNG